MVFCLSKDDSASSNDYKGKEECLIPVNKRIVVTGFISVSTVGSLYVIDTLWLKMSVGDINPLCIGVNIMIAKPLYWLCLKLAGDLNDISFWFLNAALWLLKYQHGKHETL